MSGDPAVAAVAEALLACDYVTHGDVKGMARVAVDAYRRHTAAEPTAGTVLGEEALDQIVGPISQSPVVLDYDGLADLVRPAISSLLSAAREAGLNEGRGDLEWHERRVRRECAGQLREWADVIERQNIYDDPVKVSVAVQLRALAETWAPDA